ncbi:DUF6878 family protein [Natronohydrobacter thiooxidans]|uniref:DUF6878 family protein n=1 Tax=Natronohydrobacter thiooxidans TaxID=87172 RepID=UPI0008FF2FF5|nr:DUF6878 family protein [Natronohydrobacter thiooxidans]
MRQTSPTLPAPLRPPSTDFQRLRAQHAEDEARFSALMAANTTRLYDHLTHAGITHVMVSFHCDHDICRITDLTAWSDDVERPCPDVEIPYVAPIPRAPAPRNLALSDAIARITCDLLLDLRASSDMSTPADGRLSLDARARANLLEYNPRGALAPSAAQRHCRAASPARGTW